MNARTPFICPGMVQASQAQRRRTTMRPFIDLRALLGGRKPYADFSANAASLPEILEVEVLEQTTTCLRLLNPATSVGSVASIHRYSSLSFAEVLVLMSGCMMSQTALRILQVDAMEGRATSRLWRRMVPMMPTDLRPSNLHIRK